MNQQYLGCKKGYKIFNNCINTTLTFFLFVDTIDTFIADILRKKLRKDSI